VAIIPMASAFEQPEAAVMAVGGWLHPRGAEAEGLMASSRADADLDELANRLDDADAAYLCDGSALHLRTTLKATVLFDRLLALLDRGGVVMASGEAATVLCNPMVDPRGGAPTVGLGPVIGFTVVPHVGDDMDDPNADKLHRTVEMAPKDLSVVALRRRTGLICHPDGSVTALGDEHPTIYRGGEHVPGGPGSLPVWR
jgi:cyanophycinase